MVRYPILVVEARADDVDVLIGRLTLLGAEGIEQRDASTLVHGGALGTTLLASFPDDASAQAAHDALAGEHSVRLDAIVGDAWRDAWKEHWRPTAITPRVVVVPSWLTYTAAETEIVLALDPGRAFGTGQHASTALAARAVERRIAAGPVPPVILDLGCGSGILSFVALMEGVPRAIACDIDADSVVSAVENAGRLGLTARLDARVGGIDVVPETALLVAANIEAAVLVPLAGMVSARVAPGGALVLSGVLAEQRADVERAYVARGMVPSGCEQEGAWVAPEFVRPAHA